jgi:hypothetical protein
VAWEVLERENSEGERTEKRWEVLEASYGVAMGVVAFSACAVVVLSLLFSNQLSLPCCALWRSVTKSFHKALLLFLQS